MTNIGNIIQSHKLWLDTEGALGVRANLEGLSLEHENLINVDLRHANLKNVYLGDTDITGARFFGTCLEGADQGLDITSYR